MTDESGLLVVAVALAESVVAVALAESVVVDDPRTGDITELSRLPVAELVTVLARVVVTPALLVDVPELLVNDPVSDGVTVEVVEAKILDKTQPRMPVQSVEVVVAAVVVTSGRETVKVEPPVGAVLDVVEVETPVELEVVVDESEACDCWREVAAEVDELVELEVGVDESEDEVEEPVVVNKSVRLEVSVGVVS